MANIGNADDSDSTSRHVSEDDYSEEDSVDSVPLLDPRDVYGDTTPWRESSNNDDPYPFETAAQIAARGAATTVHVEGESYGFTFGSAGLGGAGSGPGGVLRLYPRPAFPAAGGTNPYEPERNFIANWYRANCGRGPTFDEVGCWFSAHVYDVLRALPERSRGIEKATLARRTRAVISPLMDDREIGGFLTACLVRGCHLDGTFAAFSPMKEKERFLARMRLFTARMDVMRAQIGRGPPPEDDDMLNSGEDAFVYFNLSAGERKRLRVLRRMHYVVARQLILKKNKKHARGHRLFTLHDAPASEELFRVVVSFL
jgi:hypothetical protein